MKRILISIVFASAAAAAAATATVNCVTVTTFNDEAATESAAAVAQTYYDGLGRLTHSVTRGFGGDGEDVWQRTDYDRRGNVYRGWCRTPLTAGVELPSAQMFERAAEETQYRDGGDAVQDAAMTYYGNRIASVNDASLPYYADIVPSFAAGTYTQQYDEDGRLTADGTRQITRITYTDNGAQMPQSIDFANGNRIINTYLPDGTLLQRSLRTIRTRTVVRVNAQGDTIVRTIREPVVDVTRYRGDWEINGSRWRLNTPEGIALIDSATSTADMASATAVANATEVASGSVANDEGTSSGSGTGAETTFSHLWYVRDRLGSVRSVVDATGTILQNTAYYASGVPVQCFDTHRVTDRGHIGNRYLDFAAIGWYDNTARMHDALLCRFTSRDPLAADYPSLSPYTHCAANPLRYIDPTGMEFTDEALAFAKELVAEAFSRMNNADCTDEARAEYAKLVQEIGTMYLSDQLFDVNIYTSSG